MGEVKDLIARLFGEALPTIRLARRDLARSEQCPEQYGGAARSDDH
jgi:hypothetical protein